MKHRIRLGPIAIFLAIVTIVLATLAVLTTATTNADKVMAERHASVTKARYQLEAKGEKFIADFDRQAAKGRPDAKKLGARKTKEGYKKTISGDGYTLEIILGSPDGKDDFKIVKWNLEKKWKEEDPHIKVWKGED